MVRYQKILVGLLIGIFGLLPPVVYYAYQLQTLKAPVGRKTLPSNPGRVVAQNPNETDAGKAVTFQSASPLEQHAAVLTAFVLKPLYTLLALAIVVLLWKNGDLEIKSLKWAMLFFFIGENFCAANYLLTDNHDAHLLEYLHSLGMVLSFSYAAFAGLEWIDRHALHYSEPRRPCSLAGFCRHCIKFEDVTCGLQSVSVILILAGALVALMPLSAQLYPVSYFTRIWGTVYNYKHPILYQLVEMRYYPVLAAVMFLATALLLLLKKHNPVSLAKIFLAAAIGTFGFSMFRFVVFQSFRDNLVWMDVWEEATEFVYLMAVVAVLWYFRRSLFGRRTTPKSKISPAI